MNVNIAYMAIKEIDKIRQIAKEIYYKIQSDEDKMIFRGKFFHYTGKDIFFNIGDKVVGWHKSGDQKYMNPWVLKKISRGYFPRSESNTDLQKYTLFAHNITDNNCRIDRIKKYE